MNQMNQMKRMMSGVALAGAIGGLLGGLLTGCGGGGSDDPGTAVSAAPLTGNLAGQAFTAKGALASSGSSGTSVTIYEADVTCANRYTAKGRQILLNVDKWSDGNSFQLGGSQDSPLGISLPLHSVTFVSQDSGGIPKNTIVAKGRVEVIKASTKGVAGTLRLRADGGDSGSVEGEVAVTLCD